MTYNFDPELWFKIREGALQKRFASGEILREEFERRMKELLEEYEEMLQRTDIRHDYY